MPCTESLRLQAHFDGELDAISAVEFERHVEQCGECHTMLEALERTRTLIHRHSSREAAPVALRARIARALDAETASQARSARAAWYRRPFWLGALAGIGGTAVAAGLALLLILPSATDPLLNDLLAAHLRSLLPSHLIDVATSDQHTVKPWFAGRADVSPVVADFADRGYRLLGGRTDYFDHQRAAVSVYQHGAHIINVFSWAPHRRGSARATTVSGYHLIFWREGNLEYCAVSDSGWAELRGLAQLLMELSTRESEE